MIYVFYCSVSQIHTNPEKTRKKQQNDFFAFGCRLGLPTIVPVLLALHWHCLGLGPGISCAKFRSIFILACSELPQTRPDRAAHCADGDGQWQFQWAEWHCQWQ